MDRRRRRWRLALVVALAVVVLWVAWRTGPDGRPKDANCVPSREEIKDATGEVTRIVRTECRSE